MAPGIVPENLRSAAHVREQEKLAKFARFATAVEFAHGVMERENIRNLQEKQKNN